MLAMTAPRSSWRRRLRWPLALLACFLVAGGGLAACLIHKLPTGVAGADADALAHKMEQAVDSAAWGRIGAVRFVFRGETQHLWDKQRMLDRVRFVGKGEEVLLNVHTQQGRAYKDGKELLGEAKDELVKKAYARFCNDTFWLNPLAKLFDEGVTRTRVVDQDGESLIIHYGSGGVTPGDRYQWLVGPDGVPRAWRLFVSIIKIPGLEMSWEEWQSLPTGAKIATRHRALGLDALRLTDLAGAATLAELEPGADPFALLGP